MIPVINAFLPNDVPYTYPHYRTTQKKSKSTIEAVRVGQSPNCRAPQSRDLCRNPFSRQIGSAEDPKVYNFIVDRHDNADSRIAHSGLRPLTLRDRPLERSLAQVVAIGHEPPDSLRDAVM